MFFLVTKFSIHLNSFGVIYFLKFSNNYLPPTTRLQGILHPLRQGTIKARILHSSQQPLVLFYNHIDYSYSTMMQSSTNKRSALEHAYASKRHCAVDDTGLVVSKHIIVDTKR